MIENGVPIEIKRYFGLNSKTSRATLDLGFSPSVESFHDIDLSKPGVARTRGGSSKFNSVALGFDPNRLAEFYKPSTPEWILMAFGEGYVKALDNAGTITAVGSGFDADAIFDYLNLANEIFYTNGVDEPKVYDGTTQRKWGITKPSAAPTFAADSGTGITGDYQYKFSYVNSATGHESNASDASAVRTVANKTINLTGLTASADAQVDKINIYRTTDGGAIYFYLTQINNGTTTYADSTADTALGTTEAPVDNDPPDNFAFIEEWDGRVFGVERGSTVLRFSNNEYLTPAGSGRPLESFSQYNEIEFFSEILGIKKSPNFNELWVHTRGGIYAVQRTEVEDDPYRAVLRNSTWFAISHYSIRNIYNDQWFLADGGRAASLDSAGNINYESYLIEPELTGGNVTLYDKIQADHYQSIGKNQYRLIFPTSGASAFNRMIAANYLQRTPVDETGYHYPVWEYHKISANAIVCAYNDNLGKRILYSAYGEYVYIQDTDDTDDDGVAIDWSMSLGWTRSAETVEKANQIRWLVHYYNPLGDWNWALRTDFNFGEEGGQVYSISAAPEGDQFDVDFTFDVSEFAPDQPLKKVVTDLGGAYNYALFTWYGSTLNEIMEMHTIVMIALRFEGFSR